MYDLTIKDDDELEIIIATCKNNVTSLENGNDKIIDEMSKIRRNILNIVNTNYKTCDSLNIKIEDLYETLSKFTKGKENIDMILSNKKKFL